jgi:hypothetical protein
VDYTVAGLAAEKMLEQELGNLEAGGFYWLGFFFLSAFQSPNIKVLWLLIQVRQVWVFLGE